MGAGIQIQVCLHPKPGSSHCTTQQRPMDLRSPAQFQDVAHTDGTPTPGGYIWLIFFVPHPTPSLPFSVPTEADCDRMQRAHHSGSLAESFLPLLDSECTTVPISSLNLATPLYVMCTCQVFIKSPHLNHLHEFLQDPKWP